MPLLDVARAALSTYLAEEAERRKKMTELVQAGQAARIVVNEYARKIGADPDWQRAVEITIKVALSEVSVSVKFTMDEGGNVLFPQEQSYINHLHIEAFIEEAVAALMRQLEQHMRARTTPN